MRPKPWARVRDNGGFARAVAFCAGAMSPLAFSPYGYWPVGLAAVFVLYWTIAGVASRREALGRCLLFGVGKFGAGAYWIFVSLQSYAEISVAAVVLLFAAFLLVVSASVCLVGLFVVKTRYATLHALVFASGCCVAEVALSLPWALSFPWLHLGYALIETPLHVYGPLGGVHAMSFVGALSAAAAVHAVRGKWVPLGVAAALWCPGLAYPVQALEEGEAVSVALVQGNVALETKWRPGAWKSLLERYVLLSEEVDHADLVVWPEAAVPADVRAVGKEIAENARRLDGRLVFGAIETVATVGGLMTFNVAAGLEEGRIAVYRKEQLVPFGEYIPLRNLFGGLLRPLGYPMSSLEPSSGNQDPLGIGGRTIGVAICYEIAYPPIVRRRTREADIMVVLSEDSWLGDTTGPWQHVEIARMRALELRRYIVRVTNDGVTAIIDSAGGVVGELRRYEVGVLAGTVFAAKGETTYSRFGLAPISILVLLVLVANWIVMRMATR